MLGPVLAAVGNVTGAILALTIGAFVLYSWMSATSVRLLTLAAEEAR